MRYLLFLALAACGGGETPPACMATDPSACTDLLYAPTWDNVYSMTVAVSCGGDRSSCHSASGANGGLVMDTKDHAFAGLHDGRLMPGNAMCSEMVVRIEGIGTGYQMPQGDTLSAGERCAIAQWVQNGAAQ